MAVGSPPQFVQKFDCHWRWQYWLCERLSNLSQLSWLLGAL